MSLIKFVVLSDTHGKHRKLTLPKGQVIIHAGDFCHYGSDSDMYDFLDWYKAPQGLHGGKAPLNSMIMKHKIKLISLAIILFSYWSCSEAQTQEPKETETTSQEKSTTTNSFTSKLQEKWKVQINERDVYIEFMPEKEAFMRGEIIYNYPYLTTATELRHTPEESLSILLFNEGEEAYLKEYLADKRSFPFIEAINISNLRVEDAQLNNLIDRLADKKHFKKLILKDCKLTEIPATISKLKHLETLVLSFNNIAELPASVTNLKHLKYLDLRNNTSFKRLPERVGELEELEFLGLAGTRIVEFPNSIGTCRNLIKIVANSTKLKKIPAELGNCKRLKELNFGYNHLYNIPSTIGNLSALTNLNLGSNKLSQLPTEFSQLKNLERCMLDHNQFNVFPISLLGLENISTLWLHGNNLKALPIELAKLTTMTHLLIDKEKINTQSINELESKHPTLRIINE